MDPKLRQSMEKRLATLREESEANRRKHQEKKYAMRYHKIRFFERIKIERQISKILKQLKENPEDDDVRRGLKKRLVAAEEDLEYVLHFPKGEKYVSLLKEAEESEAQEHLEAERKRLRAKVKQKLLDNAIVNEPDEGQGQKHPIRMEGSSDEDNSPSTSDTFAPGDTQNDDIEHDDFFMRDSEDETFQLEQNIVDDAEEELGATSSGATQEDEDAEKDIYLEKKYVPELKVKRGLPTEPPEKNTKGRAIDQGAPANWANKAAHSAARRGSRNDTRRSSRESKSRAERKGYEISKIKSKSSAAKQPVRTRAEGGRKRRKKK